MTTLLQLILTFTLGIYDRQNRQEKLPPPLNVLYKTTERMGVSFTWLQSAFTRSANAVIFLYKPMIETAATYAQHLHRTTTPPTSPYSLILRNNHDVFLAYVNTETGALGYFQRVVCMYALVLF